MNSHVLSCLCLRSEAAIAAGDEVAPKVHFLGHFGVASLAGLKAWPGISHGWDPLAEVLIGKSAIYDTLWLFNIAVENGHL